MNVFNKKPKQNFLAKPSKNIIEVTNKIPLVNKPPKFNVQFRFFVQWDRSLELIMKSRILLSNDLIQNYIYRVIVFSSL